MKRAKKYTLQIVYAMTTEFVNEKICRYYELLKKTGSESMCTVSKLVVMPLLADMTTGVLSIFEDSKAAYIVDKYIEKLI